MVVFSNLQKFCTHSEDILPDIIDSVQTTSNVCLLSISSMYIVLKSCDCFMMIIIGAFSFYVIWFDTGSSFVHEQCINIYLSKVPVVDYVFLHREKNLTITYFPLDRFTFSYISSWSIQHIWILVISLI